VTGKGDELWRAGLREAVYWQSLVAAIVFWLWRSAPTTSAAVIISSIITLGVYHLYWIYHVDGGHGLGMHRDGDRRGGLVTRFGHVGAPCGSGRPPAAATLRGTSGTRGRGQALATQLVSEQDFRVRAHGRAVIVPRVRRGSASAGGRGPA
jgi:hypothetical protein